MVSEKHRETASTVATKAIGGCMFKTVEDWTAQKDWATEVIAAALANAEREGMRLAARELVIAWDELPDGDHDIDTANAWFAGSLFPVLERFTAILSEITDQPGSSSLPADSAPEAGSSSTVSGVTHSEPREMTGFFATLTDDQKCEALAYDGPDPLIGDVSFATNPRLTSAGTPPVDAANCERIAQAADASPSYSKQEG